LDLGCDEALLGLSKTIPSDMNNATKISAKTPADIFFMKKFIMVTSTNSAPIIIKGLLPSEWVKIVIK
jgi:hypothetical protein